MPRKLNPDGSLITAYRNLTLGSTAFQRTDDGTEVLNINGLPSGAPLTMWNGDSSAWTLSGDGTVTTGAAHSGTYGLDSGERTNNSNTRFSTTAFDLQAGYETLSFWLNTRLKESNTSLGLRWYYQGAWLGVELDVANYVTNFDVDVWQSVVVPLSDFQLDPGQNVDQFRFWYQGQGQKKQHFYLDDLELYPVGGGGGPFIFQVAAPDTTVGYHVTSVKLVLAQDNTGWDSNLFADLTELTNGILLRHVDREDPDNPVVLWSVNCRNNLHLFGHYDVTNDIVFSNNERLFTLELHDEDSAILVTDTKVLEYVVRDDLSPLNGLRAFVQYGVEDLTT